MRLIGWRHPVRHVRRKAVRGIYRSLVPRKRRGRHSASRGRGSGYRGTRRTGAAMPFNPAGCGCELALLAGVIELVAFGTTGVSPSIAAGVMVGTLVVGIVAVFVLAIVWPRKSPPIQTTVPGRQRIPTEIRRAVFNRDGGCCVECGATFDIQYDHIIPVARGGATTVENLQILCSTCNRRKSASI